MKKIACFVIIILFLLTLYACSGSSSSGNNVNKDKFYTDGFTKGECSVEEMVKDLIMGATNSINPFNSTAATKTNASIDAEMDLTINGNKFMIKFMANYSPTLSNNNTFSFEIINPTTNDISIGLYYFINGNKSDVYILLNENKIYLTSQSSSFLFPIDLSFDEVLEIALSKVLSVKDTIKYEYKHFGNGIIRHYYAKINLQKTLASLISLSNQLGFNIDDFEFLFKNLLGVSKSDIQKGNFPNTEVELEFKTENTSSKDFGLGTITSLNLKLKVEKSPYLNTIFAGEAYSADIALNKLEVKRSLNENIVQKADLSDFVSYNTQSFSIKLDYKYLYNPTPYEFLLDFFYDELNINDTKIAFRIKDKNSGKITTSIYLDNSRLYFNVLQNGMEKNVDAHLDFSRLIEGFDSFFASNQPDLNKIIIYIMGAISIKNMDKLTFRYELDKFEVATGFNVETLINILNESSDDDIRQILIDNGINLSNLLSSVVDISIDLNEYFINASPSFEFPNDLTKLNP